MTASSNCAARGGPVAAFARAAEAEIRAVGGCAREGRHQGARRLAARAHRGGRRPAHESRDRHSRDHRIDGTVRRPVRHRVGHHEQLHRNFESADDQPRRRRARHRRGAARDRAGSRGGNSGGRDLQRLFPLDHRLSRAARRRRRRSDAPRQPRSRSRARLSGRAQHAAARAPPSRTDGRQPQNGRRRRPRSGLRDQRHAVHRRDPRAADHLHDRGAARDRRCGGRSAGIERAARAAAEEADLPDDQAGPHARARRGGRMRAKRLRSRSIAPPAATSSSGCSCAPTRPCPTAR